jgi:hypothetical protein
MHGTHGRRHSAGTYTACINASEPARACCIEPIPVLSHLPCHLQGQFHALVYNNKATDRAQKKERVTNMLNSAIWGSLLRCCHAPHHVGTGKLAAPVVSGAAL